MVEFALTPGEVTTRKSMIALYGGSLMNGIVNTESPNIFVYSDSSASKRTGYSYDGWEDDSEEVIFYTGEGQVGDQKITRGNKAIFEHAQSGKTLRFFETLPTKQSGGKLQRYIGEFMLDPMAPYRWEQAEDSKGDLRQVVVFRLLRLSASSSELIGDTNFEHFTQGSGNSATPEKTIVDVAFPEAIGLEAYYTNEFEVAATAPRTGVRQESAVVESFNEKLTNLGHELKRYKIPLEEGGAPLLTDTFDVTESVLWEAKAYAGRGEVRLAIGQIFDYQRYLKRVVREFSTGIVLPERPVHSVIDLALDAGHKVAYRNQETWLIEDPHGATRSLK